MVAVDISAGHIPPVEDFLDPPDVLVAREGLDHAVKGFERAEEQNAEDRGPDSLCAE